MHECAVVCLNSNFTVMLQLNNSITFGSNNFSRCTAVFSGAIYSSSEAIEVYFSLCSFVENKVTGEKRNHHFYGGNSLFLTGQNCQMLNCSFMKNKGSGCAIKLHKKIDENKMMYGHLLSEKVDVIQIIECSFEMNPDSSSSIYYLSDKSGSKVEMIDCEFIGQLSNHKISPNLIMNEEININPRLCPLYLLFTI